MVYRIVFYCCILVQFFGTNKGEKGRRSVRRKPCELPVANQRMIIKFRVEERVMITRKVTFFGEVKYGAECIV